MQIINTYICSECGKKYETKQEALSCERTHSLCECKKSKYSLLFRQILGYGKDVCVGIDFDEKIIVYQYDDSGGWRHDDFIDKVDIKHCPFCGEKL